jgi:tetratricopeptide (TPR) repeat protein
MLFKPQKLIFTLILLTSSYFSYAENRLAPPLNTLVNSYPVQSNEPAEILEKRITTVVDKQKNKTVTVYVAIRINSKEAIDDYSQINAHYNDYFEVLDLDFANVLTEDGQLIGVKKDAIQTKSSSSENFYVDSKSLAFSLPLTYVGAAIEFQYTIKQKKQLIENEFFDSYSFNHWERSSSSQAYRSDFVHLSENIIQTPVGLNLYFDTPKKFTINYQKENLSNYTNHIWSAKKIPSVTMENYLPKGLVLAPYLDISTVSSWEDISLWGSRLTEPSIKINNEIKAIARSIKNENKKKNDQLKAVFNYMQSNIRYVFAHVGRGGYRPHNTDEIISNGYGDCKDQTVLTIALLRALNIQAYPALIATNNIAEPDEKIPQVKFDHMITYVPKQDGLDSAWIDTVGGDFLFPGISNEANNQKALILKEETTQLTSVNNPYNTSSIITLEVKVQPPKENFMSTQFQLDFSGNIESEMRSWLRYQTEKKIALQNLLSSLYPSAKINNINFSTPKESNIKITGNMSFEIEEFEKNSAFGIGLNIARLANTFSLLPKLDEPQDRIHPIFIPYDHQIITKFHIEKPSGYVIDASSTKNNTDNNSTYNYSYNISNAENSVYIEQKLKLKKINSSVDNYQKTYDNIKKIDGKYWQTTLIYDELENNLASLSESLKGEKKASNYIKLIQLLIDSGNYEEALEKSIDALKLHPDSGNIFYLKGLAHAYLGNTNSADDAFKAAEDLGYEI